MSCAGVGGVTSLGMAGLQPGSPPQWQCLHAEKTMNRVLKQIAILDLSGLQFINNDSHRHYTICFYVHFIELNQSHSQRKKKKRVLPLSQICLPATVLQPCVTSMKHL